MRYSTHSLACLGLSLIAVAVFAPTSRAGPMTPVMGLSSTELDFGATGVSECSTLQLQIFNDVDDPTSVLDVLGLELGSPYDLPAPPSLPVSLPGNGSVLSVDVRFCPEASGTFGSNLTISSSDPSSPHTVSLRGIGNLLPVCEAGAGRDASPGASIVFTAAASHDPDGEIISYSWDFGDGHTSSRATTTHAYTLEGTYPIMLSALDNYGATCTTWTEVRISPPMGPSALITDNNGWYRICLEGSVTGVTTLLDSDDCPYRDCTLLDVAVSAYVLGSGPDTVTIRVQAVDTPESITVQGNQRFAVPASGETGFFWLSVGTSEATISAPHEIWLVRDGLVIPLNLPLAEARAYIRSLAAGADPLVNILAAQHIISAQYQSRSTSCEIVGGRVFHCHELSVEEELRGPPLGLPVISIRTDDRYLPLTAIWGTDRGILCLGQELRPGVYLPTHPVFGFLGRVGDAYIAGYELTPSEPVTHIERVLLPREEVLQ